MAQANISVTENQFRCPVCLDLLKDPVSTPCGHTYCMACINGYWDRAQSAAARASCPQCRETFSPRPVLRRNTVLAEVVGKLTLSDARAAPELYLGGAGEVPCDFCPAESALRAVKSCLVCLASFCELHVLPHREVGTLRRHRLVDAVDAPAERLCAQHRLGLLEPAAAAGEEAAAGEAAAAAWSGDCLLCEADREEAPGGEGQRARRRVGDHTVSIVYLLSLYCLYCLYLLSLSIVSIYCRSIVFIVSLYCLYLLSLLSLSIVSIVSIYCLYCLSIVFIVSIYCLYLLSLSIVFMYCYLEFPQPAHEEKINDFY